MDCERKLAVLSPGVLKKSLCFLLCGFFICTLFCLSPASVSARSLREQYNEVNPSVVVIHTVERGRLKTNPNVTSTEIGLGSGVVVSDDGLILTAAHVIQVADAIEVKFLDGTIASAKVLGSFIYADIALLQLEEVPKNLAVAQFGDSSALHIGDQIFIIGAPHNLEHSLTVGYVSSKRHSNYFPDIVNPLEFIQTDAAINEGNSGGPMFNMDGQLIGIVSHFVTLSGGSEGLGLALAINSAKELLLDKKSFWTGMELFFLSGPIAKALNVPQEAGLLVQRVAKYSPASKSGLKGGTIRIETEKEPLLIGGDIILKVNGEKVSSNLAKMEEFIRIMKRGGAVVFTVLRSGQEIEIELND